MRTVVRKKNFAHGTETIRGLHNHNVGQHMMRCWTTENPVHPESLEI